MLLLCSWLLFLLFHREVHSQVPIFGAPIVAIGGTICRLRPFGCDLNCPNGFRWGIAGACSCICNDNPCQQKRCAANEICRQRQDGGSECVAHIVSNTPIGSSYSKPGECPRLMGGVCVFRCNSDAQCAGTLKCCNNGCGRECAIAITSSSVLVDRPIRPITASSRKDGKQLPSPFDNVGIRIGICPSRTNIRNKKCTIECNKDTDCNSVDKCCMNSCGRVCSPPDKATDCVHLVSAIGRLPGKTLANGYIPKCSVDGRFERVQCDKVYCWCVEVSNGAEIPGTKVFRESGPPDCQDPRECTDVQCTNSCPFGIKTQQNGCPLSNCECRNVCDDVICEDNSEVCQLVEPDCAQPPCLPVPRCLLNACPRGLPMSLPDGVTALCKETSQCSQNYWCHMVGYNGFGFCCEKPEVEVHDGQCEARTPLSRGDCQSECHTDDECQSDSKCCFDGCGLSCMPASVPQPNITESIDENPLQVALSSTIAECPKRLPSLSSSTCDIRCREDSECSALKQCCVVGCSTVCLYPARTTACIHEAITAEAYNAMRKRKCDENGKFRQIQCDLRGCFCVDIDDGNEIANTRVAVNEIPRCNEKGLFCEAVICPKKCPYGFDVSSDGCALCECRNPCKDVHCPSDRFCVMSSVQCFQQSHCPQQPRCVVNVCPSGSPFSSLLVTQVDLCERDADCPIGYWCNRVGVNVNKGMCCLEPKRRSNNAECPIVVPLVDVETIKCKVWCRSDEECESTEKCCYDGCGLRCITIEALTTSTESISTSSVANIPSTIGQCASYTIRNDCEPSQKDTCTYDADCPHLQKCCNTGCTKTCVYPYRTTGCLHLKIALQKISSHVSARCKEDGSFEHIQCDEKYCWCVLKDGTEIDGTRTTNDRSPNCESRRLCAPLSCPSDLNCAYGYEHDSNGCNTCHCYNPCKGVECPRENDVCVAYIPDCLDPPCIAIPRCVLNACPQGSPPLDESTFEPIVCRSNVHCAHLGSAFCRLFRSSGGYCCSGNEPRLHSGFCPRIVQSTSCSLECAVDDDCPSNKKCCHNGCGLSCLLAEPQDSSRLSGEKIGECPRVIDENSTCIEMLEDKCESDVDCDGVQKCCAHHCGRTCTYAEITTACLHAQGAAEHFRGSSYIPQCDANGVFARVQQFGSLRWCVDEDGREISGTRTVYREPDCERPRSCPLISCTQRCPLGFEKDDDGCERCQCRDPCRDIRCPQWHICRLVKKQCLNEHNCDPIPKCVLNVCPNGDPLISPDTRVLKICDLSADQNCPVGYFCHVVGMDSATIGYCCLGKEASLPTRCVAVLSKAQEEPSKCSLECRLNSDCQQGNCCFNGCGTSCIPIVQMPIDKEVVIPTTAISEIFPTQSLSMKKHGECPSHLRRNDDSKECLNECESDSQCEDVKKCCEYDCNRICLPPERTTNCIHLRAAIFQLKKIGAKVYINRPMCDAQTDSFSSIQCDDSGLCWCVDTMTGNEIYATKAKLPSSAFNVCANKKACAIACDDRSKICPFGLETDSEGCSRTATCRCRNPCDSVTCPDGNICLLRPRECSDRLCIPTPSCEPNPCLNEQKPAIETRTFTQFTCVENGTQICPSGFYCTGYDETNRGICCPRREAFISSISSLEETCTHGDPFSNSFDGSPLRCSIGSNVCPSTHYCVIKPTETTGICCVTKRYVCNLPMDSGPCMVKVHRYFYDMNSRSCVQFDYGGCSGNLNNFDSEAECERFCLGADLDTTNALLFETELGDTYQMGFSLSGPLLRDKHRPDINDVFRDYVEKRFDVNESEIIDLVIRDDNTVRFSLHSLTAKQKAANISNAVSDGSFQFVYNGDTYRAEPHSWFSHQLAHEEDSTSAGIFWTLIVASILFVVIILAAILFACCFLYRKGRSGNGSSSYRGASPSHYATNTAYATPIAGSPASDTSARISQRVFTTDDIDHMKRAPRNTLSWQDAQGTHTQGGRRPSRTTLYY